MRVRDLMSANVVTIDDQASAHAAVEHMVRHRIRHLPVVGPDRRLRGIVTDRDLRHHLFDPDTLRQMGTVSVERLLKGVIVKDIMSTPAVTVGPDEPLEQASRLMLKDKLGSLPVVDAGRIVGIVTETDLLRHIVGAGPCCPEVGEIIVSYP
jgi:CBS domain-containing protein